MKNNKLMLTIILLFMSIPFITAQDNSSDLEKAKVPHWDKKEYDFGAIEKGKPVAYEFTFKNIGDLPVEITKVDCSCGCTLADYTKDPVEPGEKGFVKLTYDAAKSGDFRHSALISYPHKKFLDMLIIKGRVTEPETESEQE